jgi:ribosomal protein S18 acetylase RimI-like enzyme
MTDAANAATAETRYRRATLSDVPAIMRIERGATYERLVGRSTADEHAAFIAGPTCAVWVAENSEPLAFAILTGLDDRHSGLYLKRIAVMEPGAGVGGRFLEFLMRWAFETLQAPRFSLDVLVENQRARAAYRRAGMREEGLLRSSYALPDGSRTDRVLMAALPEEWAAGRASRPSDSVTN